MTKGDGLDPSIRSMHQAKEQWVRQGWPDLSSMLAATAITRVQRVVVARVNAALRHLDLNFSQCEALTLLTLSRDGELSMARIGQLIGVHSASVSRIADHLEDRGLAERVVEAADRRMTLVRITNDGRATAVAAIELLASVQYGVEELESTEQERLYHTLSRIADSPMIEE